MARNANIGHRMICCKCGNRTGLFSYIRRTVKVKKDDLAGMEIVLEEIFCAPCYAIFIEGKTESKINEQN